MSAAQIDPKALRLIQKAANEGHAYHVTLGEVESVELPAYLVECTVTRRIGYYRDLCWYGKTNPQVRDTPAAKILAAIEAEGGQFLFGSTNDDLYLRADFLEAACAKILRRLTKQAETVEIDSR
jgi:hypothetical protein